MKEELKSEKVKVWKIIGSSLVGVMALAVVLVIFLSTFNNLNFTDNAPLIENSRFAFVSVMLFATGLVTLAALWSIHSVSEETKNSSESEH